MGLRSDKFVLSIIILVTFKDIFARKPPRNDYEIKAMLNSMLRNHDRKLRPNYLGPPVEVLVGATIMSISNPNEVNMMYKMELFLHQLWKDNRLKHDMNDTLILTVGTQQPADFIWVPDSVFIDSITSHMHHVTVNNHKLDIYPDGSIYWGSRLTVSPYCRLDLKAYPMDKHICPFTIRSYAYDSRHINYRWVTDPGIGTYNIEMTKYTLESLSTETVLNRYVAGNYTELRGKFHFKRLIGSAIMQIYIPTICLVIVSWISLWINREFVSARVALCVINLLTISNFWSSLNARLPSVNYVKAVDIFMMTSLGCVISVLLEYILVLNFVGIAAFVNRRKYLQYLSLGESEVTSVNNGQMTVPFVENEVYDKVISQPPAYHAVKEKEYLEGAETACQKCEENILADKIEFGARLIFPLIYMTFLVTYFYFYLG